MTGGISRRKAQKPGCTWVEPVSSEQAESTERKDLKSNQSGMEGERVRIWVEDDQYPTGMNPSMSQRLGRGLACWLMYFTFVDCVCRVCVLHICHGMHVKVRVQFPRICFFLPPP